jgi:hypothetical protein
MPWRRRRTYGTSHGYVGLVFLMIFVVMAIGAITIANTFSFN